MRAPWGPHRATSVEEGHRAHLPPDPITLDNVLYTVYLAMSMYRLNTFEYYYILSEGYDSKLLTKKIFTYLRVHLTFQRRPSITSLHIFICDPLTTSAKKKLAPIWLKFSALLPWFILKILYTMLRFFISHCKKLLAILCFILKIYDSARCKNMFQSNVLNFSLMSQELTEFLIVQISLIYIIRYDIICDKNLE